MALATKSELEPEDADFVNEVLIAERFHWTLDYWRSLDFEDRARFLKLVDAIDTARHTDEEWRRGSKGR